MCSGQGLNSCASQRTRSCTLRRTRHCQTGHQFSAPSTGLTAGCARCIATPAGSRAVRVWRLDLLEHDHALRWNNPDLRLTPTVVPPPRSAGFRVVLERDELVIVSNFLQLGGIRGPDGVRLGILELLVATLRWTMVKVIAFCHCGEGIGWVRPRVILSRPLYTARLSRAR